MSDQHDPRFHFVVVQLLGCYALMARLFLELPVPVELVTGLVSGEAMRDAVKHTALLAQEQPMPKDQQFQMEHACLLWLAADQLLGAFHGAMEADEEAEYEHLAAGAAHCIMAAEDAALEFGEWLVQQVKNELNEE